MQQRVLRHASQLGFVHHLHSTAKPDEAQLHGALPYFCKELRVTALPKLELCVTALRLPE